MKFTLKTTWADFLAHKEISAEGYDGMEAAKQSEIAAEFNEGINKATADLIESKVSKEDLEAFRSEQADASKRQIEAINNIVKGLSKEDAKAAVKQSFSGQLLKAITENREQLNKVAKGEGRVRMAVKVDIGIDNTIEAVGSESQTSITQNSGIVAVLRKRLLTYFQETSINILTQDEPFLMWVDELDEAGGPAFVGEQTISPDASVRYEERRAKAKTVSVNGTVTKDFLRYTNSLYNYFQNNLLKRLDIVTESGLFTGAGAYDTGDDLRGLELLSTAFDGGVGTKGGAGLVGLVNNATNWDVLRAVALQVANSYGEATALFVDSDELAKMELEKDANNNYIMPPFKSADGTTVAGMKLIPTTANLGTGIDFVGGNLSAVNTGLLLDTEIEIGRNGDDLKNRKYTVVMERQLTQFVSVNDIPTIVRGGFTAGKALLETP
jgi:hypothetical protein